MSVEAQFYSILSSIFGSELYPVAHPDPDGTDSEVAELFAVFFKVGGTVYSSLEGDADLRRPRIQLSIYGINYDNVVSKEQAVITAMKNANIAASAASALGNDPLASAGCLVNKIVGVAIDGYEKDTKRFSKTLEYYCWYEN